MNASQAKIILNIDVVCFFDDPPIGKRRLLLNSSANVSKQSVCLQTQSLVSCTKHLNAHSPHALTPFSARPRTQSANVTACVNVFHIYTPVSRCSLLFSSIFRHTQALDAEAPSPGNGGFDVTGRCERAHSTPSNPDVSPHRCLFTLRFVKHLNRKEMSARVFIEIVKTQGLLSAADKPCAGFKTALSRLNYGV